MKKFLILGLSFFSLTCSPKIKIFTLASTTSVDDCGLLDVLLPAFEKRYNVKIKIIAVGSGQAFRLGRDGNADCLLVHDPQAEEEFVSGGYGTSRYQIFSNKFILVGPKTDPAKVRSSKDIIEALKKIYQNKTFFVSRADNSGTHKKEIVLWKLAELIPKGSWYIGSGSGMETTLRVAQEKQAYCLTDSATYIVHRQELPDLEQLVKDDAQLFNPYSVILVSPKKFPKVNYSLGEKFVEYLRSGEGQEIIKNFGKDKFGFSLFQVNESTF